MTNRILRGRLRPGARRGFTLLELTLVIAIIGILMTFLLPKGLDIYYRAKVTACEANLGEIFKWYQIFKMDRSHFPKESGVKNFLSLWEVVEHTDSNAARLTCPEPDPPDGLFDPETKRLRKPAQWFEHMDQVDGSYTTYAGRDTKAFPMRSLSGDEPLVSDDNDGGPNHKAGVTLALYGNGEVKKFNLVQLKKEGVLPADEKNLEVGPDSPIEDLRKLSRD
ncbi:MAG TPA: type II secretion system protein [Planctomycetota bacterium]|jgi:general secretion pathway protein G|nr:type II secretion system protein [Planctomycetota bacterium]